MIRPNRSHPLNRGRLSWWLALPGPIQSGMYMVDIWGSNPAASPVQPTPAAGPGPVGWGYKFDGSSQYSAASMPALSAYTAVARVKFDNFAGATILKNWGNLNSGYLHWDASTAGSGILRAYVSSSGGGGNATGSTLSSGQWYRLAVTAGGGSIALYLNGQPDGTASYTGSLTSACSRLAFGCKLDDSQSLPDPFAAFLAGTIADVSLYNRALPASEIARIDIEMQTGYPSMLIRDRTPSLMVGQVQSFHPWYSPGYSGFLGTGVA